MNTVPGKEEVLYADRYLAMPALELPERIVRGYWDAMADGDRLGWRFGDTQDPSWETVKEMMWNMRPHTYLLIERDTLQAVGEFALTNFSGAAAQVHFSVLPGQPLRKAQEAARAMIWTVLGHWRVQDGSAFLRTLYGVIAAPNRAAVMFCMSCGFAKAGIIPHGTRYFGNICDGVVLMKTWEER